MKYKIFLLLLLFAIILVYFGELTIKGCSVVKNIFGFITPKPEDVFIEFVPSTTKVIVKISPEYYNITNSTCIDVLVNGKPTDFAVLDENTIVIEENPVKVRNVTLDLCGKKITKTYIS